MPELEKKKTGYTQLEVLAIYDEIQRIKQDPAKYKFKGNLASRALWAKVEQFGNIQQRTGESLRNFFKTWKTLPVPEVMRQLREKGARYSHAFKFPRYPHVDPAVDQAEEPKAKSPKRKAGGRPRKPSHEKVKKTAKRRKVGEKAEAPAEEEKVLGEQQENSAKKREQKEARKRRTLLKKDDPASEEELPRAEEPASTLSAKFQVLKENLVPEDHVESPSKSVDRHNIRVRKEFGKERSVSQVEEKKEGESQEEEDDEDQFQVLTHNLQNVAEQHDLDYDDVTKLFERCCCDFSALETFFTDKSVPSYWNPLEDMALGLESDSPEYEYLVEVKGEEEIEKRR